MFIITAISFILQRQCQPHLAETVKASVEGICLKIYHLSAEYARKIREKHSNLLKENGIQVRLHLVNIKRNISRLTYM